MCQRLNEDFLISDPDYKSVLEDTVFPDLECRRKNHTLYGKDHLPLFCSVFYADEPCGTVLVLHGFTENAYKYSELIFSLVRNHLNVVAYDQRGGTVRGTLGADGTPMCRMYYLPEDTLPRPGDLVVTSGVGLSFPKGIPIGVVRESTRGMDSNKQYIILEPKVDFQHLEYVIVLLYKPKAGAIEGRGNGKTEIGLVPRNAVRFAGSVQHLFFRRVLSAHHGR